MIIKEIDGEQYIEDGPECEATGYVIPGEYGSPHEVNCPRCHGTGVIPLSEWNESQLEQYLIDHPPTNWEYCDWAGCKFWIAYDPENKEWHAGYAGHGGYTTLGYNTSKYKALKTAVKIVINGIKE